MKRTTFIETNRTGFTLIELMVVMMLITIVLAVAIPRFEGGVFQDPAKKMSRWMINTVRTLRASAIQKQSVQILVVDLGQNKMWVANQQMSDEERSAASQKAFSLPESINIVDIQFPGRERIASGTVDIHFYPAAYSDHALVHFENKNAERLTYLVEPLLPKVKIFDEWIDF